MVSTVGDPLLLTDSDLDVLAWLFLNSSYADKAYSDWPLDRRLDGFLRREGLVRIVEDGDAYDLVLNRVMAYIGEAFHSGPAPNIGLGYSTRSPSVETSAVTS